MNKSTLVAMAAINNPSPLVPNEAGGLGYKHSEKGQLARLVITGTSNDVFYADASSIMAQVTTLLGAMLVSDAQYIAKLAVYAREKGWMKDMPAILLAWLYNQPGDEARELFNKAFPRVIDSMKMLSVFTSTVTSGAFGKRTWFSSGLQRLVGAWFAGRTVDQLLWDSVGNTPSMLNIVRLAHPKGTTPEHIAFFQWLRDKPYAEEHVVGVLKDWIAFKASPAGKVVPKVEFRALNGLELSAEQWKQVVRNSSWHQLRMNLNNFGKHGVWEDKALLAESTERLADKDTIKKVRAFPHQLLMAYKNVSEDVPKKMRGALHDALEVAVENIDVPDCRIAVIVDVSGSMTSPVTGYSGTSTSKARCVDVAALIACTILRKKPDAVIVPVDTRVHASGLEPRDTVMTNAAKLAAYGGGGTALSVAVEHLVSKGKPVDLVVMLSDNMSWAEYAGGARFGAIARESPLQAALRQLRKLGASTKLVCVDMQPYSTSQASPEDKGVLLVGGWNDNAFALVKEFYEGSSGGDGLVRAVEATAL